MPMSHGYKLGTRPTDNIYASIKPQRKYRAFTFKIKTLKCEPWHLPYILSGAQQHEGAWMKELLFTLD